MIPRKIHYCWFGGKPLPTEAKKCIDSWKKYCPDYEIIEWNEKNYNLNKNQYVKYTYENKKYAFLTDYVRLDIIYNEGGIYLDTDVELLKPLDDLLDCDLYLGMETPGKVNTGQGFGAVKENSFIRQNMQFYENYNYLDNKGNFKKIICVEVTSKLLKDIGLTENNEKQKLNNIIIYPTDYFCPLKLGTNKLKVTKNSYSIHHFSGSWKSNNKIIKKIDYYLIPVKTMIKKIIKKER